MLHQSNVLIFVHMSTGYCGCDGNDVFLGDKCLESKYNYDTAEEMADQNAEMYGDDGWSVCVYCGEKEEYCQCSDPDLGWEKNENIDYSIAFYDPDKHDCQRSGGGSFLDEYPTAQKHEKGYYFVDLSKEKA